MRHLTGLTALLGLVVALALPAHAQGAPSDGWRVYPAYNEATAVASGLGRVWTGTRGGIFSYDPTTGEIEQTTSIDGLRGAEIRSLAVDAERGVVWAGYADGALDQLTVADGSVRTFLDIERNAQYASRGIRRLQVRGDSLYAATDFGVVVFDAVREEVRNTYARLGSLPPATPVNDVLFAPLADGAAGLWLATDAGVVTARAEGTNLQSPTAWTPDPAFPHRSLSLARFASASGDEAVYVGGGPTGSRDLYRREPDGSWSRLLFVNDDLTALVPDGDRLLVASAFAVRAYAPGGPLTTYQGPTVSALRGVVVGPDGRRWAADAAIGLFALPDVPDDGATVVLAPDPVLPAGPFTNRIIDLDVAPDGSVWLATGRLEAAQSSAINRLDPETGEWTALLTRDRQAELGRSFSSIVTGPDGAVYVGTAGDGLVVISPEGPTARYDESNSSLQSAGGGTGFVVVSDVAFEDGRRWVASQEAPQVLNLFDEDGVWTALPFPNGVTAGQGRVLIAIDRIGQKWLSLGTGGVAVWDTGADPASPSDDRARQYRGQGSGGTGLPAPEVRDVVVDGDGIVWIGTTRGIATVFSPGSAFASDASLGVPQWTTTPAGEGGEREFFLRDVSVNDLDVDPAGRVWVATTSGAYLVAPSPSGSGYVVTRELNQTTSPLPSDDVLRVAVRASDGPVFLTTAEGLFSVGGDATQGTPASESLQASPSPFRPSETAGGVLVSGLASARSTVRVLTL
ncbi:MAG TPA: two-component regulator propeller domain-containing protein, partial [Rubricoccaceae bacterium]